METSLIELPKVLVEKGEAVIRALLGEAAEETGALIADQIRYARFRNQVKIFAKASALIEKSGLKINKIDLKVLVPLIELSSLEEDESIQEKWAAVIANIGSLESDSVFNKNCIEVFGQLCATELAILDYCYDKFVEIAGEIIVNRDGKLELLEDTLMFTDKVKFSPLSLKEIFSISDLKVRLFTENLTSLGLLVFEEVDWDPLENDLIVSRDTYISYLGLYFVRLCKYEV